MADGKQLIIGQDRADVVFRNLIVVGTLTAITDQAGAGDFLVKLATHLALDPGDDIEVGDVDDIVAVELLFLINSLRIGRALQQREDLLLFKVALNVTLGTGGILGQIRKLALDAAERSTVNIGEELGNPVCRAADPLRRIIQVAKFGEQHLHIIQAILAVAGSILHAGAIIGRVNPGAIVSVHQNAALHVGLNSLTEGAHAFGVGKDLLHVVVGQVAAGLVVAFEYIVSHIFILFIIVFIVEVLVFVVLVLEVFIFIVEVLVLGLVFGGLVLQGGSYDIVHGFELIVIHSVDDILNASVVHCFVLTFVIFAVLVFALIVEVVGMIEFDIGIGINDGLGEIIFVGLMFRSFPVHQNRVIDIGTGIGAGQYNADFPDRSVKYVLTFLHQLIGIDAETLHVAVLHGLFNMLRRFGVIEITIAIDTVGSVLKFAVTENVQRIMMLVHVDQGHCLTVIVLECVAADNPSVCAKQVILRGPATEVRSPAHFDFPPEDTSQRPPGRVRWYRQHPACPLAAGSDGGFLAHPKPHPDSGGIR